jgi:hypothetical protein
MARQYRLWCNTCAADRFVYKSTTPTHCPDGAEHVINEESIAIVESKTREHIYAEVLTSAEPVVQLPRMLAAVDKYGSITVALDNYNYLLAYSRMLAALEAEDVTQADVDLMVSKFPTGWNQ